MALFYNKYTPITSIRCTFIIVSAEGHGQRCRQLTVNDTLRDYKFRYGYEEEDSFCLEVRPPNISFGFLFSTFNGISLSDDNQGIITYGKFCAL